MSLILTKELLGSDLFDALGDGWTQSYNYGAYHQQSNENEHIFEIPLIGVSRENVIVDVQEYILTITAKSDPSSRFSRNFKKSWNLTKDSDIDNISAKLENGILKVKISRVKPPTKNVKVEVV